MYGWPVKMPVPERDSSRPGKSLGPFPSGRTGQKGDPMSKRSCFSADQPEKMVAIRDVILLTRFSRDLKLNVS